MHMDIEAKAGGFSSLTQINIEIKTDGFSSLTQINIEAKQMISDH